MCASAWYYIRKQVIEQYASFDLLNSQFNDRTSKHQSFNNVTITMFNKDRQTTNVNINKKLPGEWMD
jgi:hypothetical protein